MNKLQTGIDALEFINHLSSTFVLDPFAGYGNSIIAAKMKKIPIYACDIDKTLSWDNITELGDWF